MKLMGAIIILVFIVLGFFCVFAACDISYDMITQGASNHSELVVNWFMAVILLLVGMMCFAAAPIIISEMD